MKCVVKKGKRVIDLNEADRKALLTAGEVADFILRNVENDDLKQNAADACVNLIVLGAHFAEVVTPADPPKEADKKDTA